MASPAGLRLYLGSRLPEEVLDNIFCHGFELWLGRPYEAVYQIHSPNGRWRFYQAWTTVRVVEPDALSDRAHLLVNYILYDTARFLESRFRVTRRAQPRVWDDHDIHWMRVDGEWTLARGTPRHRPCPYFDIETGDWCMTRTPDER